MAEEIQFSYVATKITSAEPLRVISEMNIYTESMSLKLRTSGQVLGISLSLWKHIHLQSIINLSFLTKQFQIFPTMYISALHLSFHQFLY